jgi:hypothetical protein
MTDAAAPSPVSSPRDLEQLSQQRRRAELRLARERVRNARLGVAAVAGLALLLAIGLQTGWVPIGGQATPFEERAREFAATRIGHILLPTGDNQTCREIAFQNDTGKFGGGRTVRCVDAISSTIDQVAVDANGRALSIRTWFGKQ